MQKMHRKTLITRVLNAKLASELEEDLIDNCIFII